MVARLPDHAADSASDNSADDAADETAQESVARVSGGLVEGGDRDERPRRPARVYEMRDASTN